MGKGKTIGGIIMVVFGAILATLGFLFAVFFFVTGNMANDEEMMGAEIEEKMELFKLNAQETTGEITEIDREAGTTKIGYYAETDNSYYELQVYTVFDNYSVGDEIVVYYMIDDPSEAMVQEIYDVAADMVGGVFFTIAAVAAGIGVVGLVLLIVGIVLIVKGRKKIQANGYNGSARNFQNGQF